MQNLKPRFSWRHAAAAAAVITAGLLLLLWSPSAQSHNVTDNSPDAAGRIHPDWERTLNMTVRSTAPNGDKHQTLWRCLSDCTYNGDPLTDTSTLKDWGCAAADTCGHSVQLFVRETPYGGNWEYAGHRNHYTINWACPSGYDTPPAKTQWGPTSKAIRNAADLPKPGQPRPAYRVHCTPPTTTTTTTPTTTTTTTIPIPTPTLTVTASPNPVDEGNTVTFTIRTSGHTRTARLSYRTSAGTAEAGDFTAVSRTGQASDANTGFTRTVAVSTVNDADTDDETFTFTAAGDSVLNDLTRSVTVTIRDTTTPPPTTPPTPIPTTPPPPPSPGLSVQDATAVEGSNAVFTISLSNASGSVSWWLTGGTRPGDATIGDDFEAFGADAETSRTFTDGESRQVRVRTIKDELPEVAETFTLHARGPGGLTASGTGTIRDPVASNPDPDDDDEEDLSPTTGGWSVTGVCRDGITVLQGRSVDVILPSYFPPLASGERLTALGGYVRPDPDKYNGRRSSAGEGLPFSLNTELVETPGDVWNNQLRLNGTIRYSGNPQQRRYNTNPGVYTFDVYSTYSKSRPGRISMGKEMYPEGCSVTVIKKPSNPVCPDNRVWKRDEYVNISLGTYERTISPGIPGVAVVEDNGRWYLRGIPTTDGTYRRTLTKWLRSANWSASVVCVFSVHNHPPLQVYAAHASLSEGDQRSQGLLTFAKVQLNRPLVAGEQSLRIRIRIRDQKPGSLPPWRDSTITVYDYPEKPRIRGIPGETYAEKQARSRASRDAWRNLINEEPAISSDIINYRTNHPSFPGDYFEIRITSGTEGRLTGWMSLVNDDIWEGNEFLWYEITEVRQGQATIAASSPDGGDGAWGTFVIVDDDTPPIPPPVPNGQADLPWDADPGELRVGRPADSVLVGLPLVVYFANVKDSCLVDVKPKAKDGLCGDDIWPDNHLSPSQWRAANVVWAASPDYPDLLEGQVFTGENIMVDLGDEFGTMTECVNDPPYGPAGHGKSAPGRRYVFNRVAAADDVLGRGECGAVYVKSGYYDLTVSVGWKQRACRGADADGNGAPEAATLVCSEPIDRESVAVKPVVVNQVLQIICWNQFGAVSNPHCSDVWQPGADGSPQWTSEPGVQKYTGSTS